MWWRFLAFCALLSLVLFAVLACVNGRPALHLFFHRCCGDESDNEEVIFESFGGNYLRERLVSDAEVENATMSLEYLERAVDDIGRLMNVHDPTTRDAYEDLVEELSLDNGDEAAESTARQNVTL